MKILDVKVSVRDQLKKIIKHFEKKLQELNLNTVAHLIKSHFYQRSPLLQRQFPDALIMG
jgi:hypothetical protein